MKQILVVAGLLAVYAAWTNLRPLRLRAVIEIDATPEAVWRVLADLSAYDRWNPFIIRASGELAEGAVLTTVMMRDRGEQTFTPTVLVAEPGRELRWLGRIGRGGVFNAEHRFLIEELAPGRVRLEHSEDFTGVLVPLLTHTLQKDTLPRFEAMNRALAARVGA